MLRVGSTGLEENDMDNIRFVRAVLRDAKLLWSSREYNKRVTAFNSVFIGTYSEKWKESEVSMDAEGDPLFKKKKWNKIDSGFRLWGKGQQDSNEESDKDEEISLTVDDFLAVKKWNDFDSGFRIIRMSSQRTF